MNFQDVFYQFTDYYEKGDFLNALRVLFSSPSVSYDSIHSKIPSFHYLINYADACAFKGLLEAHTANQALQGAISSNKQLSTILDSFLTLLKYEEALFIDYIKSKGLLLTSPHFQSIMEALPPFYFPLFYSKLELLKHWQEVIRSKPEFAQLIGNEALLFKQPWHLFSYSFPLHVTEDREKGVPVIFLELIEGNRYQDILCSYKGKKIILVVETVSTFFQLLHHKDLLPFFLDPQSCIYILELYPNSQLKAQKISGMEFLPLKAIVMTDHSFIKDIVPLFTQVLELCFKQSKEELDKDTPVANWMYRIAKRLLLRKQADCYGKSRCLALSVDEGFQNWFDPHKGYSPLGVDLGPLPVDYVGELLKEVSKQRNPRNYRPDEKKRLAHIVPQVVDGGHAPTKLLRTLLLNSDQETWELFLISTERLVSHPLAYPPTNYVSDSSLIRGAQTLKKLESQGIKVFVEQNPSTYESSAYHIKNILEKNQIDIAVFHGPDEINNVCGSITNVPFRVFFDHGTLPSYPCFDLLILSSEETAKSRESDFKKMGMESVGLPFCIDVKEEWLDRPYSKKELGFPDNSFIMTTISNHLHNRLSQEMCLAIVEILKRSPEAYYAPMGHLDERDKFRPFFEAQGVGDRVIFLGSKSCPSQYARSMQLYLNEFPFGSGLGLLDAMAAGCPVVSMYDEQGPQQARYAATYFGLERVITTGRVEEYIDLACRLIQDKNFYQEWSTHAKKQYEKHVDVKAYVKNFERSIERALKRK